MNVRPQPEMLRQQSMPQVSAMPMNQAGHFLPTQPQPGQQQQSQNHMGLMPNSNNSSMGLLGGGTQPGGNALQTTAAQYQLKRQETSTQQARNVQMNISAGTPGMGGMGHMQGMSFPPHMMPQAGNTAVRRVASHPQGMNQSAGHVGGMHPGQQGVNSLSMGMNPSNSMPAHLRQANHQQLMANVPPSMPGSMSPELSLGMGRQPSAGVPSNASRPPQLMNSLSQPSGQNHGGGGQPSQNGFQRHHHHSHTPSLTSSPRPGPHNPGNMMMPTPGSSQGSTPRVGGVANHDMFMSLQNNHFPPSLGRNNGRIPTGGNQFPFVTSGSPNGSMDIPPMIGDAPPNPSNPGMRSGGFTPTPAQQYEEMSQRNEPFNTSFSMPMSGSVPPRPPSHPNAMHGNPIPSRQPPQQHSPHQPEQMAGHVQHQPQRPQSQPQGPPGRPPSQAGPSHTPRGAQSQLPTSSGLLPPARITPHSQPQQLPHSQRQPTPGQQPIAPRPPHPSTTAPGSGPPPSDMGTPQPVGVPRPPVFAMPVGLGQGLVRLLQFSGILSSDSSNKLQLAYWESLVREYFTPKALMKFTLWKDNQRNEAKPFEIGVPILPRFFLVTTQSGVKSMTLSLDGARERLLSQTHAVVECVTAVWTYKYANGYTVTLRGPLTVHIIVVTPVSGGNAQPNQGYSLKFDNLEFNANTHDKYISLESIMGQRITESPKTPHLRNGPTPSPNGTSTIQQRADEDKQWDEPRIMIQDASIPGEPVNAFGIPQATMRCLELAESVGQMTDLIAFANETKLGPIDALARLADKIREGPHNPAQGGPGFIGGPPGNGPGSFQSFHNMNGVSASPAVTLYPGMSPANPPQSHPGPSTNSPKNASSSADAPQKQNNPPPPSHGPGSAPQPTSASTPSQTGATSTPSLHPATLKRKANDTNSPSTTHPEPSNKRATRKRGRGG
ncbi:hypothetical protein BV22DRAFT_1066092 [Leucogyrophana mollusca]|uniref:Uncharacterized protein n=1 Tax=Leucogyrophana mollusca TaxID=85980 RepID=A0ACB8BGZ2_9AGAM|nr:hypothetical protein BV22DRAFT_1066092 [Leucogyrophana mollusca]